MIRQPSPTQIPIYTALTEAVAKFHPTWIAWFNRADASINETETLVVQNQSPGSLTIANGEAAIMVKRLTLAGTDRLTVQGTGRLRITT